MISCEKLFKELQSHSVDFFTGVPDSLLKDICAYITDHSQNHVIAANEGAAVSLAAGYHLATHKIPLVYMQNSGLGNAVNPLTSLTHSKVYSLPMILMIGWRGEPGVHDEPQHIKKGAITADLLKVLDIQTFVFSETDSLQDWTDRLHEMVQCAKEKSQPVAMLIRKNTFEKYSLKSVQKDSVERLSREKAIQLCAEQVDHVDNAVIVSTTGMISRELYSYRDQQKKLGKDFYNVGSMGHASQIALGIALASPDKHVFCFDGDGSVIMHMGSLAIAGTLKPKNFTHIVFDNEAHDSVGGQPTVSGKIQITDIAKASGYEKTICIETADQIAKFFAQKTQGCSLVQIKVAKGARADLIRPSLTPFENKLLFQKNFNNR